MTNAQNDVEQANAAIQNNPYSDDVQEATSTLSTAQTELSEAQLRQQSGQAAVAVCEAALSKSRRDLEVVQAKRDLVVLKNANTKADLVQVTKDIAAAESALKALRVEVTSTKTRITQAKALYSRKNSEWLKCQTGLLSLPSNSDASCSAKSSVFVSTSKGGAGAVLAKDRNVVVVGNVKVYIGACSERQYAPGKDRFDVSDRVEYEGVKKGNEVWAKTIKCTCS